MQKQISRLERLTNEDDKECDIARASPSVRKKEWRKDEKTAREADSYSLVVGEKAASRPMKSALPQTDWAKPKGAHAKPEAGKGEHFIETIVIYYL